MQKEPVRSARDYYLEQGYSIRRGLIPPSKIDDLLSVYGNEILPSREYFFRQSSNRWEKNRLSKHGYSAESFRDIHHYPRHPRFSHAALSIFCSDRMKNALSELTGQSEHSLVQSMFFDQNTETQAHQDSYYLDSLPNQKLLAAWIALEDISEEAGRFWVMPGTHRTDFELTEEERRSNGAYLKRIKKYVSENSERVIAPALKKGDVLFWNSWTIHGSSPTLDPRFSRKSLTAHYLPTPYQFGSRHVTTPYEVDYMEFEGMKVRRVPAVHSEFSYRNKLYTDTMQFLWYHPRLMKLAKAAWQVKKKIIR